MDKQNKSKKPDTQTSINAGLGVASHEVVNRYGSAAAEYIRGYTGEVGLDGKTVKGLRAISKHRVNIENPKMSIKQQAGSSAEIHYENKTNAENIIKGKLDRIRRTDSIGERNHVTTDHVGVDQSGNPIKDVNGYYTNTSQMKIRGNDIKQNVSKLLRDKEFDKYKNNDSIIIPSEQYKEFKDFITKEKEILKNQINRLEEKNQCLTRTYLLIEIKRKAESVKHPFDSHLYTFMPVM